MPGSSRADVAMVSQRSRQGSQHLLDNLPRDHGRPPLPQSHWDQPLGLVFGIRTSGGIRGPQGTACRSGRSGNLGTCEEHGRRRANDGSQKYPRPCSLVSRIGVWYCVQVGGTSREGNGQGVTVGVVVMARLVAQGNHLLYMYRSSPSYISRPRCASPNRKGPDITQARRLGYRGHAGAVTQRVPESQVPGLYRARQRGWAWSVVDPEARGRTPRVAVPSQS